MWGGKSSIWKYNAHGKKVIKQEVGCVKLKDKVLTEGGVHFWKSSGGTILRDFI